MRGNEVCLIPSVVKVNDYALYNCDHLKTVTLGKLTHVGKYAFSGTAITAIPALDDSITSIAEYAFSHTKITSVNIKDGMTVGEGAFIECKNLATVVIGNNVTIGKGAFMLDRNTSLVNGDKGDYVPYYFDNGKQIFYYEFKSSLKSLTIGENVTIGDDAFFGASKIKTVTLGNGATIGARAFYNCTELTNINLSGVKSIGEAAFSGDVYNVYTDSRFENVYIKDNNYVYNYYASQIKTADLSSLESLGKLAFEYCLQLTDVVLGEKVTVIPEGAFAATVSLKNINLDKIVTFEKYAFAESSITSADLSSAQTIGEYAFVYCRYLTSITFGADITDIEEGAFTYSETLNKVTGFENVKHIGAYAFAYTAITEADLSGAITIGDFAFIKMPEYDENNKVILDKNGNVPLVEFKVTLGSSLVELGDNPFAFCKIAPFSIEVVETFNGKDYTSLSYTFDISDTVKVIDGSLYCKVPYGLELITYTGTDKAAKVADDTVRVSAFAFAGSNVVRVELPHTLNSIGHKAFFACVDLTTVIFKSYEAPILEEEFDSSYYDSFLNFPCTGKFEFTIDDGTPTGQYICFVGLEVVPYYMWNITSGMYSNVYYGANFVDYIGRTENNLVMVRPSNGQDYETFIYGQYFDTVVDGSLAADDVTLSAIEAINKIPGSVKLEHEALVLAARAAYDKIATDEQRALIYDYYMTLAAAERKIAALKSAQTPDEDENEGGDDLGGEPEKDYTVAVIIVTAVLVVIGGGAVVARYFLDKKKEGTVDAPAADDNSEKKETDQTNE